MDHLNIVMSTVPAEAEQLLTSEPRIAHLATSVDDRPHIAPVWFEYAEDTIEILTTGQKLANIRENSRVAVSVQKDESGRTEWMVTMLGTATVIESETETQAATRRINRKYGVGDDSWPENVLVRIDIGSVTYQQY